MKRSAPLLIHMLCLVIVPLAYAASPDVQVIDDFNSGLDPKWQTRSFHGETQYTITELGTQKALLAHSDHAASALIFEKRFALHEYPILSWRWKIANIIEKGDARTKEGDDYAARLYVIFPHWFFPKTRSINYIWANKLPKDTYLPNSYTANAVMVAVQSGADKAGCWITEQRNVLDDYRRAFGEDPPEAGAIAIMTDTDNTGSSAVAWYDEIYLAKKSAPLPALVPACSD